MSADNYPSIFSHQMEAIVYIYLSFYRGKCIFLERLHCSLNLIPGMLTQIDVLM